MKKNLPAWLALVSAALLIAVGILEQQPSQVLVKAIRVCLECVGIG